MDSQKISYAGVIGAVAGVLGLVGVMVGWFSSGGDSVQGTADVSGDLALWSSIAAFAFGGAYVLMSDPQIRRAMGALMTLSAVILALAAIWGFTRADQVAAGYDSDTGLFVSALGGVLGIAGGLLALQASMKADEEASAPAAME
jgi:hypothetical protein